MENYDPKICDLCGSSLAKSLTGNIYKIGMTSDKKLSSRPLNKILCERCGLVREGGRFSFKELEHHYEESYSLHGNIADIDHSFYKDGEYITRSKATADWIIEALLTIDPHKKTKINNIFEIGSGQGNLLLELQKTFIDSTLYGCELTKTAVSLAKQKGVRLQQGDYTSIEGKYDLILAVTVIEHVPSPYNFLNKLSNHLTENGYILVIQPMQNIESYDVFFVDHLHHFHTKHIEWFGLRAGLKQILLMESPWFANNFSLHVFQKNYSASTESIEFCFQETTVEKTLQVWKNIFYAISKTDYKDNKYAIFGLGEISSLLYVYSDLKKYNIILGIDDTGKYMEMPNLYNVPVKKFDELTEDDCKNLDGVIIAVNPMYHDIIEEKCLSRKLKVINFIK